MWYRLEKINESQAKLVAFDREYLLYSNGDLYNSFGKKLKGGDNSKGYKSYNFSQGTSTWKRLYKHRLVAEAFIPNPEGYKYVNHKDHNKSNNDVSNLEWCTAEYNVQYVIKSGRARYKSRKVQQLNDNMQVVGEFCSFAEAARLLKCTKENIGTAARSNMKIKAKGFYWKPIN